MAIYVDDITYRSARDNLFAEASEKKEGYKAWFLTHTGEEFVEKMK